LPVSVPQIGAGATPMAGSPLGAGHHFLREAGIVIDDDDRGSRNRCDLPDLMWFSRRKNPGFHLTDVYNFHIFHYYHLMCPPYSQRNSFLARFRIVLVSALLALGFLSSCWAQITDSEESAQYLADHIASSAGGSSSQYLPYARKLAQTLSGLPIEKQKEILGFVPELASGEPGDEEPTDGEDDQTAETEPTDPEDSTEEENGESEESTGTPLITSGEGEGESGSGGSTDGGESDTAGTGEGSSGTGGTETDGGSSDGTGDGAGTGGGVIVVVGDGTGDSGTGGGSGIGFGGGSLGGTEPCNQLDGTPLNISYPAGNTNSSNEVFADATNAYWAMSRQAHLALNSNSARIFEQNSSESWGYFGSATFSGQKSASELQAQLDSLYANLESALASWTNVSGAAYPAAWPPTLPPVDHAFWSSACP
jgi:hypothetical protein